MHHKNIYIYILYFLRIYIFQLSFAMRVPHPRIYTNISALPPNIDKQVQLVRIQKERDQFSDELETLKERSESSQTLLMKAARDREAMQTDLEVLKERYEKSHAIQQKLQVIVEDSQERYKKTKEIIPDIHTHKLAYQLAL